MRERHAGRRRRVAAVDVGVRVAQARDVVSVGTSYLALVAAVGGWVVALAPAQSDLAPWSRWALPAVAAVALGYQARSVRDRVARFAMLAGGRLARHGRCLRAARRAPVVGARLSWPSRWWPPAAPSWARWR